MSAILPRRRQPRCGITAGLQVALALACLATLQAGSAPVAAQPAPAAIVAGPQGGPYLPAGMKPGTFRDVLDDAPATRVPRAAPGTPAFGQDLSAWLAESSPIENLPQQVPVTAVRITSGFGRRHDPLGHGDAFHSGIDFAGPVGTPIHASGDGVVIQARYSKDYGNVVMIDHGQGVVTLYAHNSRLEVRTGDVVLAGQEIARMGSTGRSTGPHLHFEVRQYGQRMNPGRWIAGL